MDIATDFSKYKMLMQDSFFKRLGKVVNVVGLTIESAGPDARLGDLCRIYVSGRGGDFIHAEVVGFKGGRTVLMPFEVRNLYIYSPKGSASGKNTRPLVTV